MQTTLLTYRQMRKIFSRDEIADLVAYKLLTPIEKTNTKQAWKFWSHDVGPDLFKKLIDHRENIQAKHYDELLANQIEHEWKS